MDTTKCKWIQPSPVNDANVLKSFEEAYRINLPDSFKIFVLSNNYAAPIPDTIEVIGFGETDVNRMLSFNRDDTETIYQVADYFSKIKLVPFASDSIGNYFCFSGDHVVFWEHETECQFNMQMDFNEFLRRIY